MAAERKKYMSIDLVLADPHPVMLDGLSHDFHGSPDFSVRACVSNGNDALEAVKKYQPDILVMDLSLTHRNGLSLIEEMQLHRLPTRAVVFTGASIGEVMRAMNLVCRVWCPRTNPSRCWRAASSRCMGVILGWTGT